MAVMSLHLVHREVRPWGDKYLVIFGIVDGVMYRDGGMMLMWLPYYCGVCVLMLLSCGVCWCRGQMYKGSNVRIRKYEKKCVADEKLSGIKLLVLLFPAVDERMMYDDVLLCGVWFSVSDLWSFRAFLALVLLHVFVGSHLAPTWSVTKVCPGSAVVQACHNRTQLAGQLPEALTPLWHLQAQNISKDARAAKMLRSCWVS